MLKNTALRSFVVLLLCVYLINAQRTYLDFKRKFLRPFRLLFEDNRREQNFRYCYDFVARNNRQRTPYTLAVNEFSDWDYSERAKLLGCIPPNSLRAETAHNVSHFSFNQTSFAEIQDENRWFLFNFDLRNHRCMPSVKYQGSCASSWAFAAITPIEFAYCVKYGLSPFRSSLSEQQLVECDPFNYGCSGGWYTNAWNYLYFNDGIAQQWDYPYIATEWYCQYDPSMARARISRWNYVTPYSPISMQFALFLYGPLVASMTVVDSFYSYSSGVYTDSACDNLRVNHGVVIVGYGVSRSIAYWVGRNSWGSRWGMNGYFMIQRGVNKCNIERYPAYVVVA